MSDEADRQVPGVERASVRRALALAVGPAAAVMCTVVAAGLVAIAIVDDRASFVEQEVLKALQKEVEHQPGNEELREKLRDLDLRLRSGYFRRRRMATVGAALLLAGGVLLVISLKIYCHVPADELRPAIPDRDAAEEGDADAARSGARVLSVGVAGVLVLAGLAVAGLLPHALRRPDAPPPDGGGPEPPPAEISGTFEENWPQFRGPASSGVMPPGQWPTEWDGAAGKNIIWRAEVPHEGRSSPVVWGDRVFLTGGDAKSSYVMCFDAASGRLLWSSKVVAPAAWKSNPDEALDFYEHTGYAAPTPVTDGRYVCAFFATADIACFDYAGRQVWAHNLGVPDSAYGLASSPVLAGDRVVLQLDQGSAAEDGKSRILAFDLATGRRRWSTPRRVPNSWSSPIVIEAGGRSEIVTCADPFVIAYAPDDGRELYRASGLSGDLGPTPIFVVGTIYATNDGAQVMALRPGGSGDVTKTHIKWADFEGMPDTASPASDGKFIIQAASYGRVTCHDVAKGKMVWAEDVGEGFNASPSIVGSRIYLPDTGGVTHIFELGPKYEPGAKCPLGEKVDASPAFVDGRIYIRGEDSLYCIGGKE